MAESFAARLAARTQKTNSLVCLGIDPRPEGHPLTHPERFEGDPAQVAKATLFYFQAIIAATQDKVACYKLQAAFFEALGIPGIIAMAQLIADIRARQIPVILDAKRGDIGSTSDAYARAYLGNGVFASDALTVNPYLGMDGLEPFVTQAAQQARGLFVLVKTSNPGSEDFQDAKLEGGARLYERVADKVTEVATLHRDASGYSPIGAVVGATHGGEIAALRERLPCSWLLVPGYGAQGAGAEDVAAAFDAQGSGALISASRSLTYLSSEGDFAERSSAAVDEMNAALHKVRHSR